jgi:DNA-binding LytR/AlgR family response regulator
MRKINCLVIDDEPLACKGLVEYIAEVDFLHCVAAVHHPSNAIRYLPEVDVMYLDINMPRISGIDFLKQTKNPPLTIITTAYQQYALEGYELDVVDYLLKPISFPRFLKASTKAMEYLKLSEGGKADQKSVGADNYFFVKSNGVLEKIMLSDILSIEGLANYIIIHCVEKKIIAYLTLRQVKEYLSADAFLQVHKSHIVARDRIDRIDRDILYIRNLQIPVGSNFKGTLDNEIAGKLLKRPDSSSKA